VKLNARELLFTALPRGEIAENLEGLLHVHVTFLVIRTLSLERGRHIIEKNLMSSHFVSPVNVAEYKTKSVT
jgi:hypothetical protein